jgi:integrase
LRGSPPVARDDVWIPPWSTATEQGLRYPPDPPTVEEIIAVMRTAGDRPDGLRLRGVIVVLWRAGLRISEALALQESDLDQTRGAVLVRRGKGGKRREVRMDRWVWAPLEPWLRVRAGCRRRAFLRAARTDPQSVVLAHRDPGAVTQRSPRGWGPAPVRAGTSFVTRTPSRCPEKVCR